jgi:hypothetical protein
MESLNNKLIENIKAAEIHNTIGLFLQSKLKGFVFNKKRKQMERKGKIKTDVIGWDIGKYENNTLLILSFTAMIRHDYVDTIIEKICEDKYFSQHSIYNDFVGELGNSDRKKDFNHYHIHTEKELMVILDEVSQFFKIKGMEYFNTFVDDMDFFKFYCIDKNYGLEDNRTSSFYYAPSYRRIMYCKLLNKTELADEVNAYNIKCLTTNEEEKYYENIVANYNEKLKIIEEMK